MKQVEIAAWVHRCTLLWYLYGCSWSGVHVHDVFHMSLMWHYLRRRPQADSALFEQGRAHSKAPAWMRKVLSLLCTQRGSRFKSHWFPGPPRKAAVIMVEVNISLKCHWKQSADKNGLYLSYVKSLADYTRRSSFLAADFKRIYRNFFFKRGQI